MKKEKLQKYARKESKILALAFAGSFLAIIPEASAQFLEPDVVTLELFEGDQDGDLFGWVCGDAGDVNGDGVQDLLVPAIGHNGFSGRVTLFSGADGSVLNDIFGGPGEVLGFSLGAAGDVDADGIPDYIIGGGRATVYSGATHTVLLDLSTTVPFAHSVSRAGDIDQDGYDDLLLGFQSFSDILPNAGKVFLISGVDGSVLWTLEGESENQFLGSAAGLVGDVNADTIPDLVIGAFGAGPFGGGEAYLLDGSNGSILHVLEPFDTSSARVFGQFFASGAGDVDGDGVGDVFVGDYDEGSSSVVAGTGRAYVFSGRTGTLIHALQGFDEGDGFGPGRGISDVNGDGHNDILVAAYTDNSGAPQAGATYLFSGRSGALLRRITATLDNDNFGVDAISTGDVNGDGLTDYLVTAVGLSFLGIDTGRAYLIAGTPLPCPADLNDNGFVGVFDFLLLKLAIHLQDPFGDLDGNGVSDSFDIDVLLKDLGRCPAGQPL